MVTHHCSLLYTILYTIFKIQHATLLIAYLENPIFSLEALKAFAWSYLKGLTCRQAPPLERR